MKKGKDNFVLVLFAIFAVIGIILLAGAAFMTVSSVKFGQTAEHVTGVITDIDTYRDSDNDVKHSVLVSYTVRGKEYRDVRLSEYSSSMYEGAEIELLYDPDEPGRVRTSSMVYFPSIILGILGAVFSLIGIIPCAVMISRRKQNQKLLAAGHVLHAQVESIDLNRNISVNGTHPYIVYCTYKDAYSGTIYRFKSGSIWTNPESVLPKGAMIDVYVDEKDYSKYYVAVNEVLQGKIVDFT